MMEERTAVCGRQQGSAQGYRGVPGWAFWVAVLCLQALQVALLLGPAVPVAALAVSEGALLAVCAGYMAAGRRRYRRSVEAFNESESALQETRLKLNAFNEHMHALHEFTHHLVEAHDQEGLAATVTDALVERFLFDSAQLWVRDRSTSRPRCLSRKGYPAVVERMAFGAAEEAIHPDLMAFVEYTFTCSAPLVVVDAQKEASGLQPQVAAYARLLGVSSCVAVTFTDEDRPIGVLCAERHHASDVDTREVNLLRSMSQAALGAIARDELQRLDEADRRLVESISTVVRTALVKIELFRSMEERIELRSRELAATQEALRAAREMVVQSEKLSSLGRMASGVIHEINDPLNFLVNILPDLRRDIEALAQARQLVLANLTDAAARAEVQRLGREADLDTHLEEMDFVFSRAAEAVAKSARIARGLRIFAVDEKPEEVEDADLLEAARSTIDLIPNKIRGQAELTVESASDVRWRVNRSQFEQVIMNLVTNALDATDRRGRIRISGRRTPTGVELSVADNGPGIPEAVKSRIFEPFFTTKPAGTSTGLGLSISNEIVRKFGGRLTVESAAGAGTVFTITFRPLQQAPAAQAAAAVRTVI